MSGERFAELITINYLPLRWQSVLIINNYLHQEILLCPFIYLLYNTRKIHYDNKIFLKTSFLIMNSLDFCHGLLPLELDRNVDRGPTCSS